MDRIDPEKSLQESERFAKQQTQSLEELRKQSDSTKRLTVLKSLLAESRMVRGLPLLEENELELAAHAWAKALRDIPTADLRGCYDEAIADYIDVDKPFGTPQLLKAWQGILDERRRQPRAPMGGKIETACPFCFNSGYQTLRTTGKRKVVMTIQGHEQEFEFEGPHTSARPCACMHAPANQRSDYPLREPNWAKNEKYGWWHRVDEVQTPEAAVAEYQREAKPQ